MLYLSRERFSTCYICPEGHSSYSSFQYSDLHSYGLILARLTPRELEVGRVAHSGAASVPEHSSQPTVYLMLRECFFMRHDPPSATKLWLSKPAFASLATTIFLPPFPQGKMRDPTRLMLVSVIIRFLPPGYIYPEGHDSYQPIEYSHFAQQKHGFR